MSVLSVITLSYCLFRQSPAVDTMVNHLFSHTTIDADILASDETSLVRAEKQHYVGDPCKEEEDEINTSWSPDITSLNVSIFICLFL